MSEPAQERDQAIAAYLLGELGAAERAEFDRRLARDPELRAEVEALSFVVGRLAAMPDEAWNAPEPPPLTLPSPAVAEVRSEPSRPRAGGWRWTPARVSLVGAVAALLLGVGVWVGTLVDGDGSELEPAAEGSIALKPLGTGGDGASGELTRVGRGDRARLTVSGLAENANDYYEVWLLGDPGLVSLGSFRVGEGGNATVDLQLPVDPSRYGSFDISLEPDDGDPAHSADSVLRGPAST